MSYQILALKYRPLVFEDVVAQEHVTKTLTRAVETGRIAHGYLFAGPRGTGKTTTARILAKALNCVEGPIPTPCNRCSNCKEITAGSSLDVLEIDAASNTGVDDIRTLRENIRYLPTSGKKRVFIIDEVHRLSGSAFDALLKTLEEPPAHAIFIFATTEPHKVPQTILSRTQRYDFHRVNVTELAGHLEKLARLEKIDIDQESLFLLARKGNGSVRDALSLLDQMIALTDGKITSEVAARTLGIVDRQLFTKLLDIVTAGDTGPVFDLVKALFESGASIPEFVGDFIDYLRNLLVQKSADDPDRFLDVSAAEKKALVIQAAHFTEADILRMMQVLAGLLAEMKQGYDEKTFLEICLLRLVRMESSIALQEVIDRLNRLSASLSPAAQSTQPVNLFGDSKPIATKKTAGGRSETPEPGPPPLTDVPDSEQLYDFESGRPLILPRLQMHWNKFLETLKRKSQMLSSLLSMGQVRSVEENVITVAFASSYSPNKQVAEKPESKKLIEETLHQFFKSPARLNFIIDPEMKAPNSNHLPQQRKTIDASDIFARDPELKAMVEKINGEIIERRQIEE